MKAAIKRSQNRFAVVVAYVSRDKIRHHMIRQHKTRQYKTKQDRTDKTRQGTTCKTRHMQNKTWGVAARPL